MEIISHCQFAKCAKRKAEITYVLTGSLGYLRQLALWAKLLDTLSERALLENKRFDGVRDQA